MGAGGAPSEGVIKSLAREFPDLEIVGLGSDPADLLLSNATKKYLIPIANHKEYRNALMRIVEKERPDFIHAQHDSEVLRISELRETLRQEGVKCFLPRHEVIKTCTNKWSSYEAFCKSGIVVPKTQILKNKEDLVDAFEKLGNESGVIWLRSNDVGGGGIGSLPTNNLQLAESWIDRFNGWGNFLAAELLTSTSVTWMSLWSHGELIVGQGRAREGWIHSSRALSGVTGVTKVGRTVDDPTVDEIAVQTILSVDTAPHGLYGVDLTYDNKGLPNPTEINIGRFFTTIFFFTAAGLNMPSLYLRLALDLPIPPIKKKFNPLPPDLMWARGMDTEPKLFVASDFAHAIENSS
jgi:hypothetical protein